jgi:hypothetical protein
MCDCGCKEYFEEDRPKPASSVIPIVQEEPQAFRPVVLSPPEQSASHPYATTRAAFGMLPEHMPRPPQASFSRSARSPSHLPWTAWPAQSPPIQLQPLAPPTSIPGPAWFVQSRSPVPAPFQIPMPALLSVAPTPSVPSPGGYGLHYSYGTPAPNTNRRDNPLRRNAMGVLGD